MLLNSGYSAILCCQSGKAAQRGQTKNWRGVGCGRIPGAISVTRSLILKNILLS